jgi:hypothetical protein
MNCLHCEDKLFVCEICEAAWPCAKDDGSAGMPCPKCNPAAVFPPGYVSLARTPERERH